MNTSIRHRLTVLAPASAFLLLVLSLTTTGCGASAEEPADGAGVEESNEQARENRSALGAAGQALRDARSIGEAVGAASRAAEAARTQEPVEVVDFRLLRDALPESVAGLERADVGGERQSMGGFSVAKGSADFRGDNRERIQVEIVDGGGLGALAMFGAAWMMTRVDRESSTGYERTTTFRTYPAYEKLELRGDSPQSQLQLVVKDRFFVKATGQGIPMEDLKSVVESIDFRSLERLAE